MAANDVPDPDSALPRMTLAEHLDELRARLLRSVIVLFLAMVAAFVFWEPVWDFVKQPYLDAARLQGIENPQLKAIDPGEGFLSVLKLSFLVGFVLASPVVIWQVWGFVAAGLYANERRVVRIFFPISLGLFLLGAVLAYQVLIPFGYRFLIGWNLGMGVGSDFRIETYLSLCLTMVFGMAVLFLLPLIMLFLQGTNIVSGAAFKKHWRIAVLLSFVVGMILTDPSPVTQVLMAMPVVGLYFLGIYGGRFVGDARDTFRWYHSWPLVLGAVLVALLLVFSEEINAWSARFFGADRRPAVEGGPGDAAAPRPAEEAAPERED